MKTILLLFLVIAVNLHGQSVFKQSEQLVSTYSIVARDSVTGEIGVAVQSHWFNVGAIVSWGEAGVGVVATQSFVNPAFGIKGLDLLKQGKTPQQVVDELIAGDEGRDFRQLAVLDKDGNTASYTGSKCVDAAGNIAGKNYSVQANLMLSEKVWPAMEIAFTQTTGPLAERMLAALEAAQQMGGDIRGMQSASIMVWKGNSTGKPWEDKLMDLRVEDNPAPLEELKRLLTVHRAYEHMNAGDVAVEKNDMTLAMNEYNAAMEMFPDNLEMKFWTAVTLANNNRLDEALPLFNIVFATDKNWKTLAPRLPKSGLLNVTEEEMKKIMSVGEKNEH
ncbi:MAG TPA: DUF1028 domain-containing protein [Ignavibacteria bacterium]|nr:DUF1028 domain-containing protein [Ignavibacteria bacterium]HMQ99960.1 DUF1028 domain-containing protein [Ignavibacteria bacterium]